MSVESLQRRSCFWPKELVITNAEGPGDGHRRTMNRSEGSDEGLWTSFQQRVRQAANRLRQSGVLSPRLLLAGGGLFMTLSNWGLLPQVGTDTLGQQLTDLIYLQEGMQMCRLMWNL